MNRMILMLTIMVLSGCAAGTYSVQTVDQMQHSEYRANYSSLDDPQKVTDCMMEVLYSYTDEKGRRPYGTLAQKGYGSTQTIIVRTAPNEATRLYGLPTEMLALIENVVQARDGTQSNIWVSPHLFSAQDYLDKFSKVVKGCL